MQQRRPGDIFLFATLDHQYAPFERAKKVLRDSITT